MTPAQLQGRRIKLAREARGLRQCDLAEALHRHGYFRIPFQPEISAIETGGDIPAKMRAPLVLALAATADLAGLRLDPIEDDPALELLAS